MTVNVRTSIVIPVCNKWELTEACLRSLAVTLPAGECEVIVMDNASSDETPRACPGLGSELFGEFFIYRRSETNLNFGPASNLGAKTGRGEYVLFLNNDTVAEPGWYEALLRDFQDHRNIAATGPLLLYPGGGPLGPTVQHLGVFVSPFYKVGHLYEGVPASSPLVNERRFFQIITAACMLMPRALFLGEGGFDEGYINGGEDVDLCARLWAKGYRMTVNPSGRVVHLASQTPGRHKHEAENARRFRSRSMRLIVPDWHMHLKRDGFSPAVSPWLTLHPAMPEAEEKRLAPLLAGGNAKALAAAIRHNPLWRAAYSRLAVLLKEKGEAGAAHGLLLSASRLAPLPDELFALLESAAGQGDEQVLSFCLDGLSSFCMNFERYLQQAGDAAEWTERLGLGFLAGQYRNWLTGAEKFREDAYLPFLRKLGGMTARLEAPPFAGWAYTLWRELADVPERAAAEKKRRARFAAAGAAPENSREERPVAFSVLMPVYNPRPEHLRGAVDSLLAQSWPHWELCMADDASTDPALRPLLEELGAKDARIRISRQPENGHIAAAANTALAMARYPYAALMDQDGLLAPDALALMAEAIAANPRGRLFYSDEDTVYDDGTIGNAYFKKEAWDWELLRGQNFVNHLGVYSLERLKEIGGFREAFPSSQDYDMLLRYCEGLPDEALIHIPKVLYHGRAHADSTAAGEGAKPEALDGRAGALAEHCERRGVDAVVELLPACSGHRLRYAPPAPAPLFSFIVDLGDAPGLAPALVQAFSAMTDYPAVEFLFPHDAGLRGQATGVLERLDGGSIPVRFLALSRAATAAERANAAAKEARGAVLGFLDKELAPLNTAWTSDVAGHLYQEGVGVLGGKLLDGRQRVVNAGYESDGAGRLFALCRGRSPEEGGYCSWGALNRSVPAVDPRCLFVRKEIFERLGGLRPLFGKAAGIDFCLRLPEAGLRAVYTPFACFAFAGNGEAPWETGNIVTDPALVRQWGGRIPPCSPHLFAGSGGDWTLRWESPGKKSV